ncbi:MAG: hypothetical protein AB7R69_01180 [Candidatus Babeliales bacterium]
MVFFSKRIVYFFVFTIIFSNYGKMFDDVLLIINFNFAHYEAISFLKKIYEPYFSKVIFYGPSECPDVYAIEEERGAFSYYALSDAMQRFPDYKGYLFCHDDCLMNVWRYNRFDLSKIWAANHVFVNWHRYDIGEAVNLNKGIRAITNCWWPTKFGYEALKNAYKETPDCYKEMLKANWGDNCICHAYADIAYIPAVYKDDFIELCEIYRKNDAWLEGALPTILSCLEYKENWEKLWEGYGFDRCNEEKTFKLNADYNHAVKLSKESNRIFVEKIFKKYGNP